MVATDVERFIEALLFVAEEPVSLQDLASVLETDRDTVEEAVARLATSSKARGIHIVRQDSHVQMATAPDTSPAIERFLGVDHARSLSSAALETLSIIAYRQPVTRAEIEAIRGVDSSGVLRTLDGRSLIECVGRLEQVGRPILYGTTFEFLQYFGIDSLEELPDLPEIDQDLGLGNDEA
ncbi:MAG: SMC-Scp complex subunit ScpB [Chloroflexota bacterium]|nr:SMC-Scp complex subunit ScpB [Chloroflexota bacterium]